MADETMTMDALLKVIEEKALAPHRDQVKGQFDTLREEFKASQMKAIIPDLDNSNIADYEGKTFAGSVVDFSRIKGVPVNATGNQIADAFLTQGGFFRKLSPAMELFARSIMSKGRNFNPNDLAAACQKQMDALHIKAATGMGEANVGFQIPVEFPAIIIEAVIALSPILAKLWRFPMNDNQVSIPKLSQSDDDYFGGVISTWSGPATTGEGSLMAPTSPSTAHNLFTSKKLTNLVVLTDELIQDSPINIINYVSGLLVRKFQFELERVVLQGNGITEPLGIIKDPVVIANAVARTTAGQMKYQDIVKLDGALNEIFTSPTLITRKASLSNLRAQVDTSGRPIYFEGYGTSQGTPTLTKEVIGLPYHVTRNCPVLGQRGDAIVGDLGMYMLGMRLDMRIDISDAPGFTKNETYIRFISRLDGKPGTSFAFKMLEGKLS